MRSPAEGGSASARARSDAADSGAVLERRPRGAVKLVHDPVVAGRRSLHQMRAHDLARGALAREQARRAGVEKGARAGGLVLEDRRAHDRMDEPQGRRRRKDAQLHERVGECDRLREVQLRELGGVPQLAVLPHQRRGLNEPARAWGDPADSGQARVRDVPRAERLQERRRGRRRGHALGSERRAQLAEQERVALSGAMARRVELGIPLAEPLGDQSRGRFGSERRRGQPQDGVLLDLGQELLRRAGAGGPPRDHHRDGQSLEPGREMREEPERRLVGAIGVVDREQERPAFAELGAEPVQPVERREHPVLGRLPGALPRPRGRLPGAEQERFCEPRRALKQRRALRGGEAVEVVLEELPHDAVRELALELDAARAVDREAALLGYPGQLAEEPALPNARLALHEEDPSGPGAGGVQLDGRLLELPLPVVEGSRDPPRP